MPWTAGIWRPELNSINRIYPGKHLRRCRDTMKGLVAILGLEKAIQKHLNQSHY